MIETSSILEESLTYLLSLAPWPSSPIKLHQLETILGTTIKIFACFIIIIECVNAKASVWRSEDNLSNWFSFPHMGLIDAFHQLFFCHSTVKSTISLCCLQIMH